MSTYDEILNGTAKKRGWQQQPLWEGAQQVLDGQGQAANPSVPYAPQQASAPQQAAPQAQPQQAAAAQQPTTQAQYERAMQEKRVHQAPQQQTVQTAAQPTTAQPTATQPVQPATMAEYETAMQQKWAHQPQQQAAGASTAGASSESSSTTTTTYQRDPRIAKNYDEIIAVIGEELAGEKKKFSPEEIEKQRKRQRANAIISALGDGISAFANLYYTTKGAPNQKQSTPNLSDRVAARAEQIKAEQKEARNNYLNLLLKQYGIMKEGDEYKLKIEREERTREKEAADKERKDKIAEAQRGRYEALSRKDEAQAAFWEAKEDSLRAGDPYDIALKKAKIGKENALADKAKRQGTSSWVGSSGSGGKAGEYPWYDKDGKLHYAKSYEAMRQNAILNGTWQEKTQETKTSARKENGNGKLKSVTSSSKVSPAKGNSTKPQQKKKWTNTAKLFS